MLSSMLDLLKRRKENPFSRSPTLHTLLMVEKAIEASSGEYTRTTLWKSLPKKMMWQTFLVVLDYLESINKIAFDREGKTEYIWNPTLTRKIASQNDITT